MIDPERTHLHIKKQQGMYPYFDEDNKLKGAHLLCNACFKDEGLRLDADYIGIDNTLPCPNCGENNSKKLTRELVRELCYRFFVRGTIERFAYGGFPLIQMNELQTGDSKIQFSPWLEKDAELIEKVGEIGLFYYKPRFWMLGQNTALKDLQNESEIDHVIDRILIRYPKHILNADHPFYRVRINPEIPQDHSQYDSPPPQFAGKNRFDTNGMPVLYGSPDLELCLHECRTTVDDDIFVAKLVPARELYMLNLAAVIDDDTDEFTSLDLAVHFLFLAGKHAYSICGRIAERIRESGFDGLIYPSYFSHIRTGSVPFDTIYGMSIRRIRELQQNAQAQIASNIALFGTPIRDGKVNVSSINKVLINKVQYSLTFGPAHHQGPINKNNQTAYMENYFREQQDLILNMFQQSDL